jgi:hypothetical protein
MIGIHPWSVSRILTKDVGQVEHHREGCERTAGTGPMGSVGT